LYHAKLHPEQYSDTFSSAQLKQLHKSILYICQTAVDLLADSSKFPEEWLFKHRWGKGKKDSVSTLPNGAKITFLTVGGRTSCVIPSVQKKTGAVAGDVKMIENGDENPAAKKGGKSNGTKKRKEVPKIEESDADVEAKSTTKKRKADEESKPPGSKTTTKSAKGGKAPSTKSATKFAKVKEEAVDSSRRRSGRAQPKV
jgi:formamidopyrimidine-DNA glycosylase